MKRLTLYLLLALTCCLVTAAGERAYAQAKNPSQIEMMKQRVKEAQQKQNIAENSNQPVYTLDPTLKKLFDSMTPKQKEQLAKMIMTVDPNTITELSALPGNTPEEKRLYFVRFLQSQGFNVPGEPAGSASPSRRRGAGGRAAFRFPGGRRRQALAAVSAGTV